MDEDELLYREMNGEDPWYMGDDLDEDEDAFDDEDDFDDEDFAVPRRRAFLLFWRPEDRHFSPEDYIGARQQFGARFGLNAWPVDKPEQISAGDKYYMVRLIEGQKGIVWHGVFASAPYQVKKGKGQDVEWQVDINVEDAVLPDARPIVSLEEMRELGGGEDFENMGSGQLIAHELEDQFDEYVAMSRYKASQPSQEHNSGEAYEDQQKRPFGIGKGGCIVVILLVILGIIWMLL